MFWKNVDPLEIFPRKEQRKNFNWNIVFSSNGGGNSILPWVFLSAVPCGHIQPYKLQSSLHDRWYMERWWTRLQLSVGGQKVLMEKTSSQILTSLTHAWFTRGLNDPRGWHRPQFTDSVWIFRRISAMLRINHRRIGEQCVRAFATHFSYGRRKRDEHKPTGPFRHFPRGFRAECPHRWLLRLLRCSPQRGREGKIPNYYADRAGWRCLEISHRWLTYEMDLISSCTWPPDEDFFPRLEVGTDATHVAAASSY